MKKNEFRSKLLVIAFMLIGIANSGYLLVSSVYAETEAIETVITGKLVPPEGVTLPEGIRVALFYPDYENPPQLVPGLTATPYSPSLPVATATPYIVIPRREGFNTESVATQQALTPTPVEEDVLILEAAQYEAIVDTVTGEFTFQGVYDDSYVLYVLPPEGSYLMASSTLYIDAHQSSLDLGEIDLVEAKIAGSLYEPDGTTPANGFVQLQDETSTYYQTVRSVNGRYFIKSVPIGDHSIQAITSYYEFEFYSSDPVSLSITEAVSTVVQNLSFDGPDIHGVVLDPSGLPHYDSEVQIRSIDEGPIVYKYAYPDYQGEWEIGELRDGTYEIEVLNYYSYANQDFLPPDPIEVVIPADNLPITLHYQFWPGDLKVVRGTIVDNLGNPITDAQVYATENATGFVRYTYTDANGDYELELIGGNWIIDIEPLDYYSLDWVYLGSPESVSFEDNETEELRTVNFQVDRYDANVTGEPISADPNISVGGYYISFYSPNTGIEFGNYFYENEPFDFTGLAGSYLYSIYPDSSEFVPIYNQPVTLVSGETVDLGQIELQFPSATIRGKVVTSAGDPIPNMSIYAYKYDGSDRDRYGTTDENGNYEIKASSGAWTVYLDTYYYYSDYFYGGGPIEVTVDDNQIYVGADFVVQEVNSTITGAIVDENEEVISGLSGWISATSTDGAYYYSEGQIIDGRFEINVISGNFSLQVYTYDAGSNYFFPNDITATVEDASSVDVTITVLEPNAKIVGQIFDLRSDEPVDSIFGYVYGHSNEVAGSVESAIDYASGSYELPVRDGLWNLEWNLSLYSDSNYRQVGNWQTDISVTANSTSTVDVSVVRNDANISGKVLDPKGNPLAYTGISLQGQDDLAGLTIYVDSNSSGEYSTKLPYGTYLLSSNSYGYYDDTLFAPHPTLVTIEPEQNLADVNVQYLSANATLAGNIVAPGVLTSGFAYVDLSTGFGNYRGLSVPIVSNGEVGLGEFSVDLTDGPWQISISYFDGSYWYLSGPITINGDTEITFELKSDSDVVEPSIIEYVVGQSTQISLTNGAMVDAPADIFVDPDVAHLRLESGRFLPLNGEMVPVGPNYFVMAFGDRGEYRSNQVFSQPLSITIPYPVEELGTLDPADLQIMHQSVAESQSNQPPTALTEIEVDTVNKTISFELDQLGYFGVVAPAEMMPELPTYSEVFRYKMHLPAIAD
ncbi:MAG: carboxypeptidase-like regulatory domain-containing protein [Chloroflexota bacterium]